MKSSKKRIFAPKNESLVSYLNMIGMKHLIALFAALAMNAYAGNAKQTDDTLYYLCDNNEKGKLDFEDEILVIARTPEVSIRGSSTERAMSL